MRGKCSVHQTEVQSIGLGTQNYAWGDKKYDKLIIQTKCGGSGLMALTSLAFFLIAAISNSPGMSGTQPQAHLGLPAMCGTVALGFNLNLHPRAR